MNERMDPSQNLENTRRKLAQSIARKSATKTDSSIRYTTATGANQIFGRTYPAIIPVTTGEWCAYHREGGDWLILGPIPYTGGGGGGGGTVTSVGLSGGTTGLTVSGSPVTVSGTMTLAGTLAIANGGTGATSAAAARAALGAGTGNGTVTSVALSGGTTGLTVSGSPVTTSGTITLAGTLAIANGGTGATSAAAARTALGATTVGSNLFTLANPSAITFLRVNADNTVSALDAATFRTAIGAGTGAGTVTSVALSGGTTGLTVSGSPITTSGTITLAGTLAVANGGTGVTSMAALRTAIGFTAVGLAIAGITNPSAADRWIRLNADGTTVTARTAAETLSDLGIGGGYVSATGGTMTGRLNIEAADLDPSLTLDDDGGLRIGGNSVQHLAFGDSEIQSKATGTTAGTMYLNRDGGVVQVGSDASGVRIQNQDIAAPGLLSVTASGAGGDLYLNGADQIILTSTSGNTVFVPGTYVGVNQSLTPSLVSGSGSFLVGAFGSTHLAMGGNDIQAKSNGTTATNLDLNPLGGAVLIGAGGAIISGTLSVEDEGAFGSTAVPALTLGAGAVLIGDVSGVQLSIGGNDIQAKSNGTTATTLDLNPLGGGVTVGGVALGTAAFQTVNPNTSAAPGANQVPMTNASGYLYTGWINTVSGAFAAAPTRIYASNDAFMRYMSPADFRTQVTTPYYANLTGDTMTGRLNIHAADLDPSLTLDDDGGLRVGTSAGQHLAFGDNEIQSKATGTTTGTLSLNPLGGEVTTGAGLFTASGKAIVASLEAVTLASGTGSLNIGSIAGNHLVADPNGLQSKNSATTAGSLSLNPLGGLVVVGAGGFTTGAGDTILGGKTFVSSTQAPTLVSMVGAFHVGAVAGTSVVIGGNDIQSKTAATTAGVLDLNPLGGQVTVGAGGLSVGGKGVITSQEAPTLVSGIGALNIGGVGGVHIAIGANDIQSKATATTVGVLDLNPLGGAVTVNFTPSDPSHVANKAYVDSVAGGGGLPLTGGTLTGVLGIETTNEVTLAGATGLLRLGVTSGQHLAFDQDEIQSKADATTAAQLNLNPAGGTVSCGGALSALGAISTSSTLSCISTFTAQNRAVVASTSAPNLTGTSNAFNVGSITGTHIAFGLNDVQGKTSATAVGSLDINPLGGAVTINTKPAATVDGGAYTPTLTSLSVGTTAAVNTAWWRWIGGPNVGDEGLLALWGVLTWGTAGTLTYPTSASRILLPAGFNAQQTTTADDEAGSWTPRDTSASNSFARHPLWLVSATELRPILANPGTAWGSTASPTATTPMTWAAGDTVKWRTFAFPAVRV